MIKNKILYCLIVIILTISNASAAEELVFSVDLIRHGDRTPINEVPKSPLNWEKGLGELTTKGMQQEKQLGAQLRTKYVNQSHLLPAIYNKNLIYVRSTDVNRTIQSANYFLLGLYPLTTRNSNQQIPVHIIPTNQDRLLVVKPKDTVFSLTKLYIKNRSLWIKKTISHQNKLQYWSNETGFSLTNFKNLGLLADNLYIRKLNHLPLPKGINDVDASQIISLGEFGMINRFKVKEFTEPMGQEFIKTILTNMKLAIEHKTSLKYILLSGHDSSIMAVMNTLQTPLEKIPHYASNLNFSLMKDNNQYYIKVNYNQKPVYIPACASYVCTFSQLEKIVG